DVYEAYMCAEDEPNSNRLDEIHFQLTNWVKITPARETAFFVEDYEQLPENSVVLGRGVPWFKRDILWYGAFGESRSSKEMAGEPREAIRKGTKHVEHLRPSRSYRLHCLSAHGNPRRGKAEELGRLRLSFRLVRFNCHSRR